VSRRTGGRGPPCGHLGGGRRKDGREEGTFSAFKRGGGGKIFNKVMPPPSGKSSLEKFKSREYSKLRENAEGEPSIRRQKGQDGGGEGVRRHAKEGEDSSVASEGVCPEKGDYSRNLSPINN